MNNREMTVEDYERVIRKLIFSNWKHTIIDGKEPKGRFMIDFGVSRYVWEGSLNEKVNVPIDWLFNKIID